MRMQFVDSTLTITVKNRDTLEVVLDSLGTITASWEGRRDSLLGRAARTRLLLDSLRAR